MFERLTSTERYFAYEGRRISAMIDQQVGQAMSNIDILATTAQLELKEYVETVVWNLQRSIAEQIYITGRKPSFSSNICNDLTCGYGKLSDWGDWQFPLYPAEAYLKTGNKFNG